MFQWNQAHQSTQAITMNIFQPKSKDHEEDSNY